MNKIIISLIIVVLLAVGVGLFFWMSAPSNPQTPSNGTNTNGLPNVPFPSNTSQNAPTGPMLTVQAIIGDPIVVQDFTKDVRTVTTSNIPGHYFIAGGIDAYANNSPYSTFYVTKDTSFTITILQQPLGSNRILAEQELMSKLGISQAAMCRLRYFVSVPKDVDATYAAKGNLGFSFCPGATQLP